MRLLPVIAVVAASFLLVACSAPTPPPGVTVVSPFNAILAPGMRLPASITILRAV